jgi:cytochrome oxidase Cu insertion factor (SCO1/SenC/PrrC family)
LNKFVFLLLFFVISFTAFSQDTTKVKIESDYEAFLKSQSKKYFGVQYPEFKVKTSDTSAFSNADLVDKIIFINFWFESCAPCIAEIDGLNEVFAKLKDNSNFLFVSFTFDADSTIRKLVAKYNIKYKVVRIDKPECYRLNFKNGFPSSFILDKKGIIRYFKAGGETDKIRATKEVLTQIYPQILALL